MIDSNSLGCSKHSRFLVWMILVICATNFGCCMCDNPFDHQYAAYGGRNPRTDMVNGRVGSAFHDAGGVDVPVESEPYYDGALPDGTYDAMEPYMDGESMDGQPFQLQAPQTDESFSTPYGAVPYEQVPFRDEPSAADDDGLQPDTDEMPAEPGPQDEAPADNQPMDQDAFDLDLSEPADDVPFAPEFDAAPTPGQPTPADQPDVQPPADDFPDAFQQPEPLEPPQSDDATDEPSMDDLDFN